MLQPESVIPAFFFDCVTRQILVIQPRIQPWFPLQWKCVDLTTGPPGKSPSSCLFFTSFPLYAYATFSLSMLWWMNIWVSFTFDYYE